MKDPKILIVMEEGIGNMVMLTPCIKAIKQVLPRSRITILGKYPALDVVKGWELVDNVITTLSESEYYDYLFLTIWSSQTVRSYGLAGVGAKGEARWKKYAKDCEQAVFSTPDMHEIEHHMYFARSLGYEGNTPSTYCNTTQAILRETSNLTKPKPKKMVAMLRVKNAIDTIDECLTSLSSYVDEIVIVDNGSTDGTQECYTNYSKIVTIGHTEGFDEGRDKRLLLEMAKKRSPDWLFWLDADEVLEKRMTRELVERIMNQDEYTSIWFKQYHFWRSCTHYRIDGRWKPSYQRCMWKYQESQYFRKDRIHNGLIQGLTGRPLYSNIRLKHYGHVKRSDTMAKYVLYRTIDNPYKDCYTGRDYKHMIDESGTQLEEWQESLQVPKQEVTQSNITIQPRKPLRIFAAFFHSNWEEHNLTPTLERFGEVIRYDWLKEDGYDQYGLDWHSKYKFLMNNKLLYKVDKAHKEKPIDVFFSYLSGRLVFPSYIRKIQELGIKTVNLALDDATKFHGMFEATGYSGQVDICNAFDLCWTSHKPALEQYRKLGANPIYLPPGANPDVFKNLNLKRDTDVCFIGQNYGIRPEIIRYLQDNGVRIRVFGRGWRLDEITTKQMIEIYNRSKIVLGIGTAGNTDKLIIKGRDFEVPMCGAFYLTQNNPDLREFYNKDEVVFWSNKENLLELIKFYLDADNLRDQISQAAYKRSQECHTWEKRFETVFRKLGAIQRRG